MYSSFDLGKVENLIEGSYSVLMYRRLPSSSIDTPILPNKAINVLHSEIRYYFENADLDYEIVLDVTTVQNIILNCFNGRY